MSAFEQAVFIWYVENASGWAARAGITARAFECLRLTGARRSIFLRAMQMIEQMLHDRDGE